MIARTPFVNIIQGPYRRPLVKAAGHNLSVRLVHRLALLAMGWRDVVAIATRFQALMPRASILVSALSSRGEPVVDISFLR